MAIALDAEVGAVLMEAAAAGTAPVAERGDAAALRAITNATLGAVYGQIPAGEAVTRSDFEIEADDGAVVPVRWYVPDGRSSDSAVVYAHGGGMICGSIELYDKMVAHYAQLTGVAFLSVDYRLAPENTGERLAKDVYAALNWLLGECDALGVDPRRVAIMGDSGGGGVAAGAAILARDSGVPLARQILIYPMLDSRNLRPDPELAPTATWTYDDNFTGWNALLPDESMVSAIASPAHLEDFSGLAPSFIDVGDLDIFRDESIEYAQRLLRSGVSCELHVRSGAPHAFEWLAPQAAVSRQSLDDRLRVIRGL
ncbi:alpha/beta hydrolase [Dietzia kunjamensis]|uniref:alpha/beta hydrolase n=1 Tax=Dietzia kunjamensis TaxID=322509 RepID=UPI0031378C82